MGRGGASKDRSDGPDRKCIATGEVQPKHGLVRFVVGPDGTVYPDVLAKLPGRGMYVAADRAAIELAVNKKLFTRAAKQQVTVPDGLVDEVEKQLARRVVDLISLQYIGCLTADELGLAFGRQTVIHGALASGGLTQRVVEEAQRLKGVRINEAGKGQPKG